MLLPEYIIDLDITEATLSEIANDVISESIEMISSDRDCYDYAEPVKDALTVMLNNYIKLEYMPLEPADEQREFKHALVYTWLSFLVCRFCNECGGSCLDYAMSHVLTAMESYDVVVVYNAEEMYKDVYTSIKDRALYPDREFDELAQIGIVG